MHARLNALFFVSVLVFVTGVGASNDTAKHTPSEVACLAMNIYFEARGEPLEGRIAVAWVTLNRVRSKQYPDTVCEVVWQKNWSSGVGRDVAQFSWTLDTVSNVPTREKTWARALRLARKVYAGQVRNNARDATYYHANRIQPWWARHYQKVATVGKHTFYSAKPRKN